ncbi:hypothetical protein EVAR_68232_1 [Eumeta japonica]|uniref:Uncharacterized protein n=1 Tax=Eumeta variegata TaxID=151549 RepID=A0A4C2ABF5_EUMVA|nr:hypothetical protein EVAR_68232_1 [Eumeta japonica]
MFGESLSGSYASMDRVYHTTTFPAKMAGQNVMESIKKVLSLSGQKKTKLDPLLERTSDTVEIINGHLIRQQGWGQEALKNANNDAPRSCFLGFHNNTFQIKSEFELGEVESNVRAHRKYSLSSFLHNVPKVVYLKKNINLMQALLLSST